MVQTKAPTPKVVVVPGKVATLATALRGHINTSIAYMRLNEPDLMEESIRSMRRDVTSLERELRLNMGV